MKFLHSITLIILSVMMFACQHKDDKDSYIEARELFTKSAETITRYIKDIQSASDSTSVDSLYNALEKKLVDINFSFPPETDLKLNAQENDSLYFLLIKIKQEKQFKLEQLKILTPDTLENINKLYP